MPLRFLKPEKADAHAALAVTRHPSWDQMDRMLEREITKLLDGIVANGDETSIHTKRGQVQALQDIRALRDEAPGLVDKFGR